MIIPKQIIAETSRACNLRCLGCPINTDPETGPRAFMDVGYFRSIVDRINFPTVFIPWLGGEPLMHPDYTEMVKYVTDREIPMYITTNGHFWNDELFDHILGRTSCYQIIFSLDGLPGSKSITAARPGSNPGLVVENIRKFLDMKLRTEAPIDVAVKIVHRGQDYEEIEEYINYWLDRGIDYVCVGKMLDLETEKPMRRYPCQYFDNNFMVIRHDGTLVLCAYNDHVVNDGANPLFKLDETTPLLEAYNDYRYEHYRQRQLVGQYDGPCGNCGFAYTGQGFVGDVVFRSRPERTVHYKSGYYNQLFSLTKKDKPAEYYQRGSTVEDAGRYYG